MPDFTIRIAVAPKARRAVTAIAYAANASTQPLAAYQALRMNHHRRSRATWWLLTEGDVAAAALVCHPLTFSIQGRVVPGYGLGAVATRPEYRKRGYATALCRHVAEVCEGQFQSVGLLFSAIPPAFYERLGYQVTPAWGLRCDDPAGFAASGPATPLRALDPYRQADALLALYNSHHMQHHPGLHLHRDQDAWARTLVENPSDLFLGWGDPLRGYVRLLDEEGEVEIVELVAPDPEGRDGVLRAAAEITAGLGRTRIQGWLPPSPATEGWFEDVGRAHTQPMVRGTDPAEDARFWGSDYF